MNPRNKIFSGIDLLFLLMRIPANFEDEESFFFFLAENGSGQVNVGLFYENNGDYISSDKYTLNFDLS